MGSIFRIIFLSGIIFVHESRQQSVGNFGGTSSGSAIEENDNLEALTSPENYIADWLPALNKLGLALASLKVKVACIDLQGVQARLKLPSCSNVNGDLNKNLTDFKGIFDKLTEEATTLETQAKDTTRSPSISSVLVQTADVHNLRVNANVAVKNVVEILSKAQEDNSCLVASPSDMEAVKREMDTAIEAYWAKVIPVTSSVFKVTYGDQARMKFRKLVDETFMT